MSILRASDDIDLDQKQLLRVAAIQLQPRLGDGDANLDKARLLIRQAIAEGAQWIVLPELFTTGMAFDDSHPTQRSSLPKH